MPHSGQRRRPTIVQIAPSKCQNIILWRAVFEGSAEIIIGWSFGGLFTVISRRLVLTATEVMFTRFCRVMLSMGQLELE